MTDPNDDEPDELGEEEFAATSLDRRVMSFDAPPVDPHGFGGPPPSVEAPTPPSPARGGDPSRARKDAPAWAGSPGPTPSTELLPGAAPPAQDYAPTDVDTPAFDFDAPGPPGFPTWGSPPESHGATARAPRPGSAPLPAPRKAPPASGKVTDDLGLKIALGVIVLLAVSLAIGVVVLLASGG
jgi:hypothetical protein